MAQFLPFRIGYTLRRQGEAGPVTGMERGRKSPCRASARRASPLGTAVETPSFAPDVRCSALISVPLARKEGMTGAVLASSWVETPFDGARKRVLTVAKAATNLGTETCPGRSFMQIRKDRDLHGQTTGPKRPRERRGVF